MNLDFLCLAFQLIMVHDVLQLKINCTLMFESISKYSTQIFFSLPRTVQISRAWQSSPNLMSPDETWRIYRRIRSDRRDSEVSEILRWWNISWQIVCKSLEPSRTSVVLEKKNKRRFTGVRVHVCVLYVEAWEWSRVWMMMMMPNSFICDGVWNEMRETEWK